MTHDPTQSFLKHPDHEDCFVYIKTLRIYNSLAESLSRPIVCEQLFSCQPITEIIEVSFIHINETIIYFKRIFEEERVLEVNEPIPCELKSNLQLFQYDLLTQTETAIKSQNLQQAKGNKLNILAKLVKAPLGPDTTLSNIKSGYILPENPDRF